MSGLKGLIHSGLISTLKMSSEPQQFSKKRTFLSLFLNIFHVKEPQNYKPTHKRKLSLHGNLITINHIWISYRYPNAHIWIIRMTYLCHSNCRI